MSADNTGASQSDLPNKSPLSGYRVLDLTDERGLLAGNIFAKLGADVIQIEPPQGSTARSVPPLLENRSFFWDAYAAGKRGVSCNLETERGRELIRALIERSDFLIESEDVGKMTARGLGWETVSGINPRLIHVSITAFGSTGPKARAPASDLTIWAAAGPLLHNRDGNGPPLRLSVPQAYLHASVDAVAGALVALSARHKMGIGQHVDISAQQCVAQSTLSSILSSTVNDPNFSVFELTLKTKKKFVDMSGSGARTRRSKWVVSDGLIELHLAMGPAGWSSNNLFSWMKETDEVPVDFSDWDWRLLPQRIEAGEITDDAIENARAAVAKFLLSKTKQAILVNGLSRRITMAPVATTLDLVNSEHFAAREYFTTIEDLKVPGPFAYGSNWSQRLHRAPQLGEHNHDVYGSLGLDATAIRTLAEQGVI